MYAWDVEVQSDLCTLTLDVWLGSVTDSSLQYFLQPSHEKHVTMGECHREHTLHTHTHTMFFKQQKAIC